MKTRRLIISGFYDISHSDRKEEKKSKPTQLIATHL
jgi:hypothetical protein